MKTRYKSLILIVTILLTAGCGGSYKKVNTPTAEIMNDKNKAYIIFSRPEFVGTAISNTVMEYNPLDPKEPITLIAILGAQTKVLYTVDPGTHYFYMRGGEGGDKIKTTVEAGKVYYIQTAIKMGWSAGRFIFEPLTLSMIKPIDEFYNKKCTDQLIAANFFKIDRDKESDAAAIYNTSKTYYKNNDGISIACEKGIVIEVDSVKSIAALEGATLVEAHEPAIKNFNKHLEGYKSQIEWDKGKWDTSIHEVKARDGIPLDKLSKYSK